MRNPLTWLTLRAANLRTPVSVAGAGAGAVAVALGAKSVKAKRDGGAGVEVWNAFVSSENPVEADPAVFAAITTKYGADFSPERAEAVKSAYAAYLGVLIPPGAPLALCRRRCAAAVCSAELLLLILCQAA